MSENENRIISIADRVVSKSQDLTKRCRDEMEKLEGRDKSEFVKEIARLTQDQAEKVAFAAQVLKEMVEGWTDEDFTNMKASREDVETDLSFSKTILPLSEIHTESQRRKANARERLEKAWGDEWEEKMGELIPPWPAEEFLRELARFAERNTVWDDAKAKMTIGVAERLAAKRTKKYKWVMTRDIAEKTYIEKKQLRGNKNHVEVALPSSSSAPLLPSPTITLAPPHNSPQEADTPNTRAAIEMVASLKVVSQATSPSEEAEAQVEAKVEVVEGGSSDRGENDKDKVEKVAVAKGKGKEVVGEIVKKVEVRPEVGRPMTKRRRESEKKEKKRRFKLDIPVINLDVDEGVDELKRKAEDEKDKDDALAVEGAIRSLTAGEGRPNKETLVRRLEKLLEASRAEMVENID